MVPEPMVQIVNGDEMVLINNVMEKEDISFALAIQPYARESDPLLLHGADHPGMVLVTTSFNGSNYLNWSRAVRLALKAESKLGFISGNISVSKEGTPEFEQYEKVDSMVTSWIFNSLMKDIADAFIYIESAKVLWNEINERYGESNGPLLYHLQKEISNFTQGTASVVTYFTKLKRLWDECASLMSIPSCPCGSAKAMCEYEANVKLMQFLMGLHEDFDHARDQILMMEPLPSLNKAYSMVLKIEKQKNTQNNVADPLETPVMMAANNSSGKSTQYARGRGFNSKRNTGGSMLGRGRGLGQRMTKEERDKLHCTHCGGTRHEVSECFKLHGFPDWYKKLREQKNLNSANMVDGSSGVQQQKEETTQHIVKQNAPDFAALIQQEVAKYMEGKLATGQNNEALTFAHYTDYAAFLAKVDEVLSEPMSYLQAAKSDELQEAMLKEIQALEHNQAWELVSLPPGKKAIGSKWVYKIKRKADGGVERFKARLVAKSFNQVYGIDYFDSFSPVAKVVTVRFLVALAAQKSWPLHHIDINNAFLHGYLHEEVYMKLPHGYFKAKPGQVCLLKKSLYCLKQASREWNLEFTAKLTAYGLTQSVSDTCLFVKHSLGSSIYLLAYVDDLLITGDLEEDISALKTYLDELFTIKDLGYAKFFLGMELLRTPAGIHLSQRKYIVDLLKETGLTGCKAVTTPFPQGFNLSAVKGDLLADSEKYRRLVGKLFYLNLTRPDICFAVQQLSQYMSSPTTAHWDASLHLVKYLKDTPSHGLFYLVGVDTRLHAYSDANWGTCQDTRRSLTGYAVFLGHSLISWKTKKQKTVAKSSAEAEYRALSSTVCELLWLSYISVDLKLPIPLPVPLHCDNRAAIHITENPVFHERTKHLDIDCHVIRNQFKTGFVDPHYISTSFQLADVLTKALGGAVFLFSCPSSECVLAPPFRLEGGMLSILMLYDAWW